MKQRIYWTEEEINQLKELYENKGLTISLISPILNRDELSIRNKINKLKLKHTKEQTRQIKSNLTSGVKNPMYGKHGWRRGLSVYNSDKVKTGGLKISESRKAGYKNGKIKRLSGKLNPMFGETSWCNGLTKETDKRIYKRAERASHTLKQKFSSLPESEKEKIRKRCAIMGANCKKFKTSIEIKIENFLAEQQIKYISGFYKDSFVFDFYLPEYNCAIECQGDYWHANPLKYNSNNINSIQQRNIQRDMKKQQYLIDNNIKSLFIWEYDIKRNFEYVKSLINNSIADRATELGY